MKILEIITEALTQQELEPFTKDWDESKYADIFQNPKYKHSKDGHRVYLPLEPETVKIPPNPTVHKFVKSKGYEITDYRKGLAKKPTDNREIKIGKLLDDPSIKHIFDTDPVRGAQSKYMVIISRNPYDIAKMSTNRGWTSCMNLECGVNKQFVPLDIKHGTIIAYLVPTNDQQIDKPVGRVLIKPYVSQTTDKIALGIESQVYGTDHPTFIPTVRKWVDEVNASNKLKGVFTLHPELYPDSPEHATTIEDWSIDENIDVHDFYNHIHTFFTTGEDAMSDNEFNRAYEDLIDDYYGWLSENLPDSEEFEDWFRGELDLDDAQDEIIKLKNEYPDANKQEIINMIVKHAIESKNELFDNYMEKARDNGEDTEMLDIRDWMDDFGIHKMSDIVNQYTYFRWPAYKLDYNSFAMHFERLLNKNRILEEKTPLARKYDDLFLKYYKRKYTKATKILNMDMNDAMKYAQKETDIYKGKVQRGEIDPLKKWRAQPGNL